ncbi:MAG: response regulator transcription factor [Planctomycetota bacterium]|nr:response regulator transcription factor [Planctomycetota bacterium]
MSSKILVIEDEPDMAMGLRDNLEFEGYEVLTASDGESGLEVARRESLGCILLDQLLPGIDGFETCRRLRSDGVRAPILILTALGQEIDKVRGLELGADDYITKPFGVKELVARIRAALRRYNQTEDLTPRESIVIGRATVCFTTGRIVREGQERPLGHYEGEILRLLFEKKGQVLSRPHLLKQIWGLENEPMNRSIDNHIVSLRRKIEEAPTSPQYIVTVHGMGYKLVL